MTSGDWPPFIILLCGCLFLLLGLMYPWLSTWLGVDESRPERRVLSVVLGVVLLSLWAIWRFFGQI
jgi:hypothetical protein